MIGHRRILGIQALRRGVQQAVALAGHAGDHFRRGVPQRHLPRAAIAPCVAQRFPVVQAPQGDFLTAAKLLDRYGKLPAEERLAFKIHRVQRGDTLSKIAKQFYGNANDYPRIFEANKPMLTHPDKIYPGQNLRIPPKA